MGHELSACGDVPVPRDMARQGVTAGVASEQSREQAPAPGHGPGVLPGVPVALFAGAIPELLGDDRRSPVPVAKLTDIEAVRQNLADMGEFQP